VALEEADQDRRGSHATPYGQDQDFSWVVGWTILGTVLPGSGLMAAGRRRLGGFLLAVLALGLLGLGALLLLGNPMQQGIAIGSSPQKLLLLALMAGVAGLVWAGLMLLTTAQLRRHAVLSFNQNIFSWVVVVALVAGIALPTYKVSSYALLTRSVLTNGSVLSGDDSGKSGPNAKQADPWASQPRENVLVIGSDAGSDRTGVRPDSLILTSINTKTGNTVMFGLPRNLQRVPFAAGTPGARAWPNGYYCPTAPKGQECMLNAIWQWASTEPGLQYYKQYKKPGLQATRDAVQGLTGLKPDTYVMLNLAGFKDFVDAAGGVTVNVKEKLPMGGNSEDTAATFGWIKAGNHQHLDGFHALWFARSRWSTTDFDRMARQRCVIGAVISQANPAKLALGFPLIAKTLKKNLQTGINVKALQAWVTLAERIKSAKVTSLPFTGTEGATKGIINTTNPDFPQIRALVAKAIKASDKKKAAASSSPSPSVSASTATKKTVKTDLTKAQDIKAVC